MKLLNFIPLTTVILLTATLAACGGSGGGSDNNGNTSTSSVAASSSTPAVFVAQTLAEIDPIKQPKPSIKFLQYTEALILIANETLYLKKAMENTDTSAEPDIQHGCAQRLGTYLITATKPVNDAREFKITFNNCFYREYNAVLTGEVSVKITNWNRIVGVDGSTQIQVNQLDYTYNQVPLATITGGFELAYATGEDFANKVITAKSNINFKTANVTDSIKSLSLSHKTDYAKGNYLIDLNLRAIDKQINGEFDLLTEQSLSGKVGRSPGEGNIKSVGYSNNFKYIPVLNKDEILYKLSFDLGNKNDYQTLPDNRSWMDFSNLSLFWDYTAQRTFIDTSTGAGGLRVYPNEASLENRGFYVFGTPGIIGYYNELKSGQNFNLYTYTPVNSSQSQQITVTKQLNEVYVFELVANGSNKITIIPPANLPAGWYDVTLSIVDEAGGTINQTFNLHYISPDL